MSVTQKRNRKTAAELSVKFLHMIKISVFLIILFVTSSAGATSIACRPGEELKALGSGVEVEISGGLESRRYELTLPKIISGNELRNAEIVVGTFVDPRLVFALKLEDSNGSAVGRFSVYQDMGEMHVYASYGGQCEGATIWQKL